MSVSHKDFKSLINWFDQFIDDANGDERYYETLETVSYLKTNASQVGKSICNMNMDHVIASLSWITTSEVLDMLRKVFSLDEKVFQSIQVALETLDPYSSERLLLKWLCYSTCTHFYEDYIPKYVVPFLEALRMAERRRQSVDCFCRKAFVSSPPLYVDVLLGTKKKWKSGHWCRENTDVRCFLWLKTQPDLPSFCKQVPTFVWKMIAQNMLTCQFCRIKKMNK